jgi:hypothetical protein
LKEAEIVGLHRDIINGPKGVHVFYFMGVGGKDKN